MTNLKDWLTKGREEGFAIGAFNAANLETVKAIVAAAKATQSPVIIEASQGEAGYFGFKNFLAVVGNFKEETGLPIFTNLDHGRDIDIVETAIDLGFDMVHFDGSDLSFEENLKAAIQLTNLAHQSGVLIETEFEKIMGSSQLHEQSASEFQVKGEYTDPNRAEEAVMKTGTDVLAISVGNLHGVYQGSEELDLSRLEEIVKKTSCFLSMHGGSGIDREHLKKAIGLGVVKVNINTDLRLAYRETLENVLKGSDEVKIYKLMLPVIGAVQKIVEEKIRFFGSSNRVGEADQIPKIKVENNV